MNDSLDWLNDPYRDWPQRYPGRNAVGHFCSYVPLELLHAAGLTPVRIVQLANPIALANAHLPSFSCATARVALERLLSGQLAFLTAVIFGHTCDTMQSLADVWRMVDSRQFVLNLSLPTVLSAAGSFEYTLNAFRQLLADLQSICSRTVSEEALRSSIAMFEERRLLMAQLYQARDLIRACKLWQLTVAGLVMPVEEHLSVLRKTIAALPGAPLAGRNGPRLAIAGTALYDGSLFDLIEELGGQIVADNLCTGARAFQGRVDIERYGDALPALAWRALERPPCPAKHKTGVTAAAGILELARSSGAVGVVLVQPKYCDPCAFDYVAQRQALQEAGIPHTALETETGAPSAQARTRLQALLEMLA